MGARWMIAMAFVPAPLLAQSGQTFQFQEAPPPPNLGFSVSESQLLQRDMGQSTSVGNECQAMLQQLDSMKNEPLRRDALWQRYRNQCQAGLDGAPSYAPPMPQ